MSATVVRPPSAPPLLTADEFAARYANVHAELVQGVVKESPVPWPKHGKACLNVAGELWSFLRTHDLGHAMSNDSWVRTATNPDTVRGSDVCFFSYERLPKGEVPDGLLPVVPDLVFEVRSPSDRWNDIFIKVGEYLNAGVRVVVVLDAKTASATVYRPDELQQTLHNGDELTLPDVLPGFAVRVSSLFA